MIIPFPESSLNQEAGKLFMENYQEYFKIAKLFTEIHAKLRQSEASRLNLYKSKLINCEKKQKRNNLYKIKQ